MPPSVESPLSLSITLTSLKTPSDIRTLRLKPGEAFLIGRASGNTLKNIQARPDNALYDCPVVSREHAELRAHLWDSIDKQVSITDKGSMHGTRVNGVLLREGQPTPLQSGDRIQFGERVTRGDNSHEGIYVTFDRRSTLMQESSTQPARSPVANFDRGFHLRYTSDEESDYESDDEISVVSGSYKLRETSSAKTTPEQSKAKLGSQELPIDLDGFERPKSILVEDSTDEHAAIVVSESIPISRKPTTYIDIESDAEGDDDSVIEHNTGLTNILNEEKDGVSEQDEDENIEQDQDDVQDEELDVEYPNNDVIDEIEDVYDSDSSELNRYGSEAEQSDADREEDEDLLPESPSPSKEPSPELLSSAQSRPAISPYSAPYIPHPPTSTLPKPASSQYDPVRGYQYVPVQPISLTPSASRSVPPPPSYVNYSHTGPSSYYATKSNGFGGDAIPSFGSQPSSSRWDKTSASGPFTTPPDYPLYSYGPPANSTSTRAVDTALPYTFSHAWNDVPTVPSFDFSSSFTSGYSPVSPKLPSANIAPKNRISIPSIMEDRNGAQADASKDSAKYASIQRGSREQHQPPKETVQKAKAAQDATAAGEPVKPVVKEASAVGMTTGVTPSTSNKRKADEMDDPEVTREVSAMVLGEDAKVTAVEPVDGVTPVTTALSPRKKTKITDINSKSRTLATASNVAASVAKYAAVASAGGAGMLAFLCSPASEQLLNWLS